MDENYLMITLALMPLVITVLLQPYWVERLKKMQVITTNYKGNDIVKTSGPVLFIAVFATSPILFYLENEKIVWAAYVLFISLMMLIGLLDDLWGDETVKGFAGHFRKTFLEKKATTGFIKATGGWGVSLIAASLIIGGGWYEWVVRGTYLALVANFFNLMDTRPARSLKLFVVLSMLFVLISRERAWFFIPFWSAILGYLHWETSEKSMLGDTGAFLLGSSLGVYSLFFIPIHILTILVVFLILIHRIAEKVSIGKLLDQPFLQVVMFHYNKWGKN